MLTALSNSMKLSAMQCRETQDRWVRLESSDKMWSTGEGKCKMVLPLWKTIWQLLIKLNMLLLYDPATALLYPKELKIYLHKGVTTNVDSSSLHNCLNLEATKMFFSR